MFADAPQADPYSLFATWFAEAEAKEPNDPNAMALATVAEDGMPSLRMVLLKGYDHEGFVFYTNFESRKGRQLLAQPKAALLFHWKSLRRQVRIEGPVEVVSDAEADEYFGSRPKQSQIGAWASKQSRPLKSRFELEKQVALHAAKYAIGRVPRPSYWSGFRLRPRHFEFWEDRPFRLHDRVVYDAVEGVPEGASADAKWRTQRLFP